MCIWGGVVLMYPCILCIMIQCPATLQKKIKKLMAFQKLMGLMTTRYVLYHIPDELRYGIIPTIPTTNTIPC